jgi:hypothetical protein
MSHPTLITPESNPVIVVRASGAPGRTIISGSGNPSNSLGVPGDFYFDVETTRFWGPKSISTNTWSIGDSFILDKQISTTSAWEIGQLALSGGVYSILITHNLGFYPNVTVKNSAGDVLETGIDYNSLNTLTLTMAQPFAGTAYLS